MRYLGRWINSLRDSKYPPPQELVGEYEDKIQSKIVNYLNNGHILNVYRGQTFCLFRCNHHQSFVELTDGRWVWPRDLAHYVHAHSVQLPPDFIADALSSTEHPKFNEVWRTKDYDFKYWSNWCNQNASGHFKDSLSEALEKANHEAEIFLRAKSAEIECEIGVSDTQCSWVECPNKALLGIVFCGPVNLGLTFFNMLHLKLILCVFDIHNYSSIFR